MSTKDLDKRIERANRCRFGVGTREHELGEPAENMKRVKKEFFRTHAIAIHLSAIAIVVTVWYGFSFASRINLT